MSRKKKTPSPPAYEVGLKYLKDSAFCAAFRALVPGEALVYYTGHLSHARLAKGPSEEVRPLIKEIASAAMQFEQEGRAELVQHRLAKKVWEYSIVKRHAVVEGGRCRWDQFGSRNHGSTVSITAPLSLSRSKFEERKRFLATYPSLSPGNFAVHDEKLDGNPRIRMSYAN